MSPTQALTTWRREVESGHGDVLALPHGSPQRDDLSRLQPPLLWCQLGHARSVPNGSRGYHVAADAVVGAPLHSRVAAGGIHRSLREKMEKMGGRYQDIQPPKARLHALQAKRGEMMGSETRRGPRGPECKVGSAERMAVPSLEAEELQMSHVSMSA